jgi:uncharacterized membrane protein YhaH (DUF805 family)
MKEILAKLFPKRIGRMEYLVRVLVILGAFCGFVGLMALTENSKWGLAETKDAMAAFVIGLFTGSFFLLWLAVIPRVRDTGLRHESGLLVLVWILIVCAWPVGLIVLFLVPTDFLGKPPPKN